MLTGELPGKQLQPPSKKVQIDVRLDEVVLRALEQKPELRYQQVSEVKTLVETIASTSGDARHEVTRTRKGVPVLRWRDRWIWDTSNVVLMAFVPFMVSMVGLVILFPIYGAISSLAWIPGGIGLLIAPVYGLVGWRVRKLKSQLPKSDAEMAEALIFERPKETPGLALLHADRLELFGVAVIGRLVIPLDEIVSLSEVRWFNGRRLWWKRGFVLDLKNGRRIGVAVPEPFGRRWRAKLSGGTLPELPDVETEKVESGKRKVEIVPRFLRKAIIAAMSVAVSGATLALFTIKSHHATPAIELSQSEFLDKVASHQIVEAKVVVDQQSLPLVEITGTFYRADKTGKATSEKVPFVVHNAWLTPDELNQLPRSPNITAGASNVVVKNLLWGIAPFLILGVCIFLCILLILGIIIYLVWRAVHKPQRETTAPTPPGGSRREEAQTEKAESESRKAENGKPSQKNPWLLSPLASPEVREISAHLTKEERSEAVLHGLLWGVWVVLATFGNFWLIKSVPAPGSWIVASVIAVLFFASLPPWARMQRRVLCSTTWAKEQGYTAGQIKLFSFSRRNFWRVLIFAGAVILLGFGQGKLFMHLSGVSELTQNLKEDAAQTKKHMARLADQENPNAVSAGHVTERTVAGPPFLARLNQAEVELVALGDMPWTNPICWLPNGTLSSKPFPDEGITMNQWAKGMVVEKIAFRVHNESTNAASYPVCRVNKESGASTASTAMPAWGLLQLIVCPSNATTVNLCLGLANGPWETATAMGHEGSLGGATANGDWSATWNAAVGHGDVAVNCTYTKSEDWETRMVGMDVSGRAMLIPENSSRTSTLSTGGILLVSSNEFARIKEFQLQRRKYQWAEFRNVSLQPGHQTAVVMKDFGGENHVAPTSPTAPSTASDFSFGRVMQFTLPMDKDGLTPLFDLDQDQPVLDPNPHDTAAGMAQLLKPGVVIRHDEREHKIRFLGLSGTVVGRLSASLGDQWQKMSDTNAFAAVRRNTTSPGVILGIDCPDELPQVVFFKTGAGRLGILQITGFTEHPRGVSIRYKLAQ